MVERHSTATELSAAESQDAAAQEAPSFAVVYERYFDLVWTAVRHLGVPEQSVEDVVQEVFVVIHSRLPSLQKVESLRSWVYSVARRTVSTHRRAQRVRNVSGAQYAEVARLTERLPPTPLQLWELADRQRLLLRLLADLDEAKREVFLLTELEGFTAPEIAEALEIPVNTVYSRLRTARETFQHAMARYEQQKGSF
ncbi:MAG: RNA polymerase sigma factor [Myxococcales bacterium]|nr:MAG: RNA polymerase sigma factor [Myxococcales bacterium]